MDKNEEHTKHNPQEIPNCKYEKGYYILMEYFDCIPEGGEREEAHERLKAIGL